MKYCWNCENQIGNDDMFCQKCGRSQKVDLEAHEQKQLKENQLKKDTAIKTNFGLPTFLLKIVTSIGGIIGAILGYAIGRLFGWLYLLIIGAYIVFLWQTYKFILTHKINSFIKSLIVWSNVITWIIPPIGIYMSVAALGFAKTDKSNKYKTIAIIGMVLAIINAAIGAYQGFMKAL